MVPARAARAGGKSTEFLQRRALAARSHWIVRPIGSPRMTPQTTVVPPASDAVTSDRGADVPGGGKFGTTMGHPSPLWMLFMTEFWERFAFYGIRWALVLYIVAQFHNGDPSGQTPANLIYGSYLALVYAAAIIGGYIADRVHGYQRSILLGAAFMSVGLFMIAIPHP